MAQQHVWTHVCAQYFDDVARVELRFKHLAMLQPEHEAMYQQALAHVKKQSNMLK